MALRAAFSIKPFENGPVAGAPITPVQKLRFSRLRRDAQVYELTRAVAGLRHVTLRQLLAKGRGTAGAAGARQLAMYLAHVLLGRPQDAVGALFGRDASTVSHACKVMEDLRDHPPLETEIARIEAAIAANGAVAAPGPEVRRVA